MPLTTREEIVHFVGSAELERFIQEVYGHSFDYTSDQDTELSFSTTFFVGTGGNDFYEAAIARFIANGGPTYFLAAELLEDLYNKNYLAPGTYIVTLTN